MENRILIAMRGFEEPQENSVKEKLNEQGAGVESIVTAHTKMGVLQACTEDEKIKAAIVSEYLESGSPYKPEEFDEVDSIREDLRVIPILIDERRGKKYAEKLYAQAIYNAIFEENADMAAMADLIKNGRNKKAARLYYGIQKNAWEFQDSAWEFHKQEEINTCLVHALDGGKREDFLHRLSYVRKRLPYQDFATLISRLPEEYGKEAKENGEFQEYFSPSGCQECAPEKEKNMENRNCMSQIEHMAVGHKAMPNGTMELGICAAGHGIGATYTSILCANSLAWEYKVAYVEQNVTGHMRCLMEALAEDRGGDIKGGIFSYQGVDYYFGMDYLQFATEHRNAYDFVVADFGVLEEEWAVQEFFRMNRYFVVFAHVPWRKEEISNCCKWLQGWSHREDAVCLTPYAATSGLRKHLDISCDMGEILEVGYAADAFDPEPLQKELFYRLCGVMEEEKKDKLSGKLKKKLFEANPFAKKTHRKLPF